MRLFRFAVPLLAALAAVAFPFASFAQVSIGVSVTIEPPALPVYEQPPIPAPGYIWTPGYWAYGDEGYYWVPGTWVEPPAVGLLWTPAYWGWSDGAYVLHAGYWGPHIGFYGGINYGFGYVGVGYEGGYWEGDRFSYNSTVNNFGSTTITNTYSKTVVTNTTVNQVSYNGGPGGTKAEPTPQEQAALKEQHAAPTAVQTQHEHAASTNKALLATVNHGKPAVAATAKPGEFTGKGVVRAKNVATTGPSTGPGDKGTNVPVNAPSPKTGTKGKKEPGSAATTGTSEPGSVTTKKGTGSKSVNTGTEPKIGTEPKTGTEHKTTNVGPASKTGTEPKTGTEHKTRTEHKATNVGPASKPVNPQPPHPVTPATQPKPAAHPAGGGTNNKKKEPASEMGQTR